MNYYYTDLAVVKYERNYYNKDNVKSLLCLMKMDEINLRLLLLVVGYIAQPYKFDTHAQPKKK